jgi:DNA end-binding protein Ku
VIRNHEHIGVIGVHGDMLILNQLRYKNELLSSKDLKIPALKKGSAQEIAVAIKLIDQLTEPFKPEKYKDSFTEDIKKMIKGKKSKKPEKTAATPKPAKIHDMMDLLKESLKKRKKSA